MRRWALLVALLVPTGMACTSLYSSDDSGPSNVVTTNKPDATAGADGALLSEDASRGTIDPNTDGGGGGMIDMDAGTDAAQDAGPVSCAALRALTGAMTDGKYMIDVDGDGPLKAFQVYCFNMADPTKPPAEYLSVPSSGGSNVSKFAIGGYCTGCTSDFVRQFTRVRLRVPDLTVLTNDVQFASALAACGNTDCQGTDLQWGMAGSCVNNNDSSGTANIDLTGTPFHLDTSAKFGQTGFMPAGSANVSTDRKTVSITGGGACGWTKPTGMALKLAQD
jgi:hypothetical protein